MVGSHSVDALYFEGLLSYTPKGEISFRCSRLVYTLIREELQFVEQDLTSIDENSKIDREKKKERQI